MAQAIDPLAEYIPLPGNLVEVPPVRQHTDFTCGAAATLAILRFWSVPGYDATDESALYAPLQTTQAQGTEPGPMTDYLNEKGLRAEYRHTDVTVAELKRAIDRREPPIVDLQAWRDHARPWRETWDAGHYVLLVGYDQEHLFFSDPGTGEYAYLTWAELEERWHDVTGDLDAHLERMAIFVRGATRWTAPPPQLSMAPRLG